MSNSGWVQTPKFILRGSCVRTAVRNWVPGSFLEMGTGTGEMTKLFLAVGFEGVCYDIGPENRELLRDNLRSHDASVRIIDDVGDLPRETFDYLFAFEVLEHIEKDLDVLRQWSSFLRRGGKVLISVPAHQRKFDADDEAVGHYRRYEKESLRGLLENAGFENIQLFNQDFHFGPGTVTGYTPAAPNTTSFRAEPCTSPPPVGARARPSAHRR